MKFGRPWMWTVAWILSLETIALGQQPSALSKRVPPAADVIRSLDASANRRRLIATTEVDTRAAESQGCVFVADAGNLQSLSCPDWVAAAGLNLFEDLQGGGSGSAQNTRVSANLVHALGFSGTGMIVAVLDSGYDYSHRELESSYRGGIDYVNNDGDPMDDHGHGTAVSGLITADGITSSARGAAPNAGVLAIKVIDSNNRLFFSTVIQGLRYVIYGPDGVKNSGDEPHVDVINLSLYSDTRKFGFCDTDPSPTIQTIKQLVEDAADRGIPVVAGAGNDGLQGVSIIACLSSVLSVANLDVNDTLFPSSSQGESVDIAAPGTSTQTVWPGNQYISFTGTSASTPIASAVVALLKEKDPTLGVSQIQAALFATAVDLGAVGKDPLYGHGKIHAFAAASHPPGQMLSFSLLDRGGISRMSTGASADLITGYASIQADASTAMPTGVAIFGFRQNGILVTEAGVPAAPLIRLGRIYAEVGIPVNTGVAIANPNPESATVNFYFTDGNGSNSGSGTFRIPPNGRMSAFLNESPFSGSSTFNGTFTFSSSVSVSAIAIRGLINERSEFLITTLPVADLNAFASSDPVRIFPHFAAGGGWTSQLILVNPGDGLLTGVVEFFDQGGTGAMVTLNGQQNSSAIYSIPPRSSRKIQVTGSSAIAAGWVRITPGGSPAPSAVTVFSLNNGSTTITEAGVPSQAVGNAFRLYAEAAEAFGAVGSIQTGVAVVNTSAVQATVTLELTRLDGTTTGFQGTLTIPARGQSVGFLNQVPGFESLNVPFQGVLRVSSTASIAVVGLRGRYNERGDFLVTTLPTANEPEAPSFVPTYFPHIVDSGGYTTQFVLISGQTAQPASGRIKMFTSSGGPWSAVIQ